MNNHNNPCHYQHDHSSHNGGENNSHNGHCEENHAHENNETHYYGCGQTHSCEDHYEEQHNHHGIPHNGHYGNFNNVNLVPDKVRVFRGQDGTMIVIYSLNGRWFVNRLWNWLDPWWSPETEEKAVEKVMEQFGGMYVTESQLYGLTSPVTEIMNESFIRMLIPQICTRPQPICHHRDCDHEEDDDQESTTPP